MRCSAKVPVWWIGIGTPWSFRDDLVRQPALHLFDPQYLRLGASAAGTICRHRTISDRNRGTAAIDATWAVTINACFGHEKKEQLETPTIAAAQRIAGNIFSQREPES